MKLNDIIMQSLKSIMLTLLLCMVGNMWGEDVYYEKCSSINDIVDGGSYIIVIAKYNYYAIHSGSTNCLQITPENDGTIKNPSTDIVWKVGKTDTQNGFTFKCGSFFIYNNDDTTLDTNKTSSTTWVISQLAESPNAFTLNRKSTTGRYIGWSGSNSFAAYATKYFSNQLPNGKGFGQYSGALYIYKIKDCNTITLGANGYSTYCSDVAFTANGADVYKAAYDKDNSKVSLTKVETAIPAGEGVILKGTEGASVTIIPAANGTVIDDNALTGVNTSTTGLITTGTNYVLSTNSSTKETAFVKMADGKTVDEMMGKAYMNIDESAAKSVIYIGFNESSDINTIEIGNNSDDKTYNLAGQRVNANTKGLLIVNGRKFINK